MTPGLRKLTLTAHVTFSVGWLGAVLAYFALAVTALSSRDAQVVRSFYPAMESIGWLVLVPCSLAALLTGLVQSLATEWGLFRHYWILAKLLLSIGGTTVLLLHMPTVGQVAELAAEVGSYGAAFGELRLQLVIHAGGGLLVLLAATALSVYNPWGRTRYGLRTVSRTIARPGAETAAAGTTPWRGYLLFAIAGLFLLLVVLHLLGGGPRGH